MEYKHYYYRYVTKDPKLKSVFAVLYFYCGVCLCHKRCTIAHIMINSEASGEGSLNVLHASHRNDNVHSTEDQTNGSFHSTETIAESSTTTSTNMNISVASESNILVPGELFSDIATLIPIQVPQNNLRKIKTLF